MTVPTFEGIPTYDVGFFRRPYSPHGESKTVRTVHPGPGTWHCHHVWPVRRVTTENPHPAPLTRREARAAAFAIGRAWTPMVLGQRMLKARRAADKAARKVPRIIREARQAIARGWHPGDAWMGNRAVYRALVFEYVRAAEGR